MNELEIQNFVITDEETLSMFSPVVEHFNYIV